MLLFGDRPIGEFDDDRLDVSEFAAKIAASILAQSSNHGLVIGIEGKWGAGKSSLNFLIQKQLNQAELPIRPIVIAFEPWLTRGVNQLVAMFFDALLDGLKAAAGETGRNENVIVAKFEKVLSALLEYRDLISRSVGFVSEIALPTSGDLAAAMSRSVLSKEHSEVLTPKSLSKQKEAVISALRDLNRSLVISIDDLDRLDPVEAMEVLRLVRAVADFPNTTYLLNYDPEVLSYCAQQIHGVDVGQTYLEKIVNVPVRVPTPEAFALRNWFEVEAQKVIATWMHVQRFSFREHEAVDLNRAISDAGVLFLKSPRDVRRALDALRLSLASTTVHLWLPDLVWLSILKIGNMRLYKWIEGYLAELALIVVGDAFATDLDQRTYAQELKKIAQIAGLSKSQLIRFMQTRVSGLRTTASDLFLDQEPNSRSEKDLFFQAVSQLNINEKLTERRLSSPEHYRYFFGFQAPSQTISEGEEVDFKTKFALPVPAIEKWLIQLDNQRSGQLPSKLTILFRYLKRIRAYYLDEKQRINVLHAIAIILDDRDRFEIDFYNASRRNWSEAVKLLSELLPETETKENQQIVEKLFEGSPAASWLAFAVYRTWSDTKNGQPSEILNDWQFKTAKQGINNRFRSMSIQDFKSTAEPANNFFRWTYLDSGDQIEAFVNRSVASDEGFLAFVGLLVSHAKSTSNLDSGREYQFQYLRRIAVEKFLNYDETVKRLTRLSNKTTTNAETTQAAIFLQALRDGAKH